MNDVGGMDEIETAEDIVHHDDDVLLRETGQQLVAYDLLQVVIYVLHDEEHVIECLQVLIALGRDNNVIELRGEDIAFEFGQLPQNGDLSKYLLSAVRVQEDSLDAFAGIDLAVLLALYSDDLSEAPTTAERQEVVVILHIAPDTR